MPRLLSFLVGLLTLTGVYLYAFPAPTLSYGIGVMAHIGFGLAATALMAGLARRFRAESWPARLGWLALATGAVLGVALMKTGATLPFQWLLYTHIAATLAGVTLLAGDRLARIWGRASALPRASALRSASAYAAVLLLLAGITGGSWYQREVRWRQSHRIVNPAMPPGEMRAEGLGPRGPFFPSSLRTPDGKTIKPSFFMDSQACERCHSDVYHQWLSSAHRFSSFNNQWYRKSIEYMQDVVGTQPSKWCGGCHDPAVLIGGLMDTPIKEIIHRPESQAGLGCVACHAITEVDSTMGQGGFTMEYPTLSDLAASEQPVMRFLHDFLVKVNPEPHRRAFIKPFMKGEQSAEFCSTCHKVHLDVPVNDYRWIRGFNDYDNWQASGVSGMGARSFYYPPTPQRCVDCHMPKVQSGDFGNKFGFVSSHRVPAANTALPFANGDKEQLDTVTGFLKNDIISVDVFAIGKALKESVGAAMVPGGELSTTFAVGEEGSMETFVPGAAQTEAGPITAPLSRANASVRRGDAVRVDVVVRTRKVGHFFPGGTVDAFDVWVELQAIDDRGQILFWSGRTEGENGPVEPGAHFYRSLLLDAEGNPINKRNAWASRAVMYVRLIPPGAADTVHYRLDVPEHAGGKITLKAKVNYRKFSWYNTHFSYAGIPDPSAGGDVKPGYDNRKFLFTGDTSGVSGKLKEIPNLPIVVLAENEVTVGVLPKDAPEPEATTVLDAEDWTRWNDYGIGLLLQGDLRGAERAFMKVTEIVPDNPDGWVNIGRVRVQEGNTEGAREVLERALKLAPDLARANYFYARLLRAEGDLDGAVTTLRKVVAQYPKDRVVRNDLGRNLFLLRRFGEAAKEFETTLSIDPEDLTAHYNLMLTYRGLKQPDRAAEHQKRYLRFKADEASQAITGPYRLKNPHDNNERQAIHEHRSAPLGEVSPQRAAVAPGAGGRAR
jgi:cytochrome c-type biogenesis protein CcmH/NrfG